MTRFPADRLDRAWAILIALTLVSMTAGRLGVAGHAGLAGLAGLAADGVVLAAAVFKARQVLMDFLGLRTAPPGWRALFTSWLVLVAATAWIAAAVPVLRAG